MTKCLGVTRFKGLSRKPVDLIPDCTKGSGINIKRIDYI